MNDFSPLAVVLPLFCMVVLTVGVGILMFVSRVRGVRSGQVHPRFYKTFTEGQQPEFLVRLSRHFTNLFEVPVLFYAGGAVALALHLSSPGLVFCAWLFVVSRVAHTIIHLGPNTLYPRIAAFFTGVGAVLAMWVQIVLMAS